MSERLDRIEQLLSDSVEQRNQDRKDWLERDRQFSERVAETERQTAKFWEGLNETKALQQQNAERISQELEMISQMRQALVEQNKQIQNNRADIARLDGSNDGDLN